MIAEKLGQSRSTFFNRAWLWAAAGMILFGMILRERSLSLLGFVPLITAGGAWLWARYSLDRVEYTRALSTDRAFSGDQVSMRVSVVNRKLLPLAWLEIEDQMSDRLQSPGSDVMPSGMVGISLLRITTALRWYERVTWHVPIDCPSRGYFTIGPASMRSSDAFGFFQRKLQLDGELAITVYPKIAPLDAIPVPARHLFGDRSIRRHLLTDPSRTIGVRDYRPEDSFRFVHWKATARTQQLQTRIFEPTTAVQFGIFLNLDTFERYWEGLDFDRAEGAIITAATIATQAMETGSTVGMYANGIIGGSDQALRIRPGRSPAQLDQILTGLAKLSPIASLNFPQILRAEMTRFPTGSTVVVITAIMTESLRSVLAHLAGRNHEVVVLTVGDVAVPPSPRLTVCPIDLEALKPYIPRSYHYAVQIGDQPTMMTEQAET